MDKIALARALWGGRGAPSARRTVAKATSDSYAGAATVSVGGVEIEVPCTGAVRKGDDVAMIVQGGLPFAVGSRGCGDATLDALPALEVRGRDSATGEERALKSYSLDALRAASSEGDPAVGQFVKRGGWCVLHSSSFVELGELFADAGVGDLWSDGSWSALEVRVGGSLTHSFEPALVAANASFFGNLPGSETDWSFAPDSYREATRPAAWCVAWEVVEAVQGDGETAQDAVDGGSGSIANRRALTLLHGWSAESMAALPGGSSFPSPVDSLTLVAGFGWGGSEVESIPVSWVEAL